MLILGAATLGFGGYLFACVTGGGPNSPGSQVSVGFLFAIGGAFFVVMNRLVGIGARDPNGPTALPPEDASHVDGAVQERTDEHADAKDRCKTTAGPSGARTDEQLDTTDRCATTAGPEVIQQHGVNAQQDEHSDAKDRCTTTAGPAGAQPEDRQEATDRCVTTAGPEEIQQHRVTTPPLGSGTDVDAERDPEDSCSDHNDNNYSDSSDSSDSSDNNYSDSGSSGEEGGGSMYTDYTGRAEPGLQTNYDMSQQRYRRCENPLVGPFIREGVG